MIKTIQTILVGTLAGLLVNSAAHAQSDTPSPRANAAKNVVLVHGAFADGSGWRGVYDELTRRGYRTQTQSIALSGKRRRQLSK